jgi:hypothetical protein
MLLARLGIDDVYNLVSTGQTFPDEGSNTRYSSSSFAKNAQTCRTPPSWEPAREIGCKERIICKSSHEKSLREWQETSTQVSVPSNNA